MPDPDNADNADNDHADPDNADVGADGEILKDSFVADVAILAAVDLARTALEEITPAESIGELIGHSVEGERVVSLLFDCTLTGYPGWQWTVTLARTDENAEPTVLETELMPGGYALTAPDWVPWSDRLVEGEDDEDDDDDSDDDDSDDDGSFDDESDDDGSFDDEDDEHDEHDDFSDRADDHLDDIDFDEALTPSYLHPEQSD